MQRFLVSALLITAYSGCTSEPTVDTGPRLDHWIEVLGGPDARLRKEAAFKLGNLGLADPETVVEALTAALLDADPAVRCEVILALLKCGPEADQAIDQLVTLQRDDGDPRVREYAGKALERLAAAE